MKDAPALARELRWRARAASGYNSDDEVNDKRSSHLKINGSSDSIPGVIDGYGHGSKRKRSEDPTETHFRNFQPKAWEGVTDKGVESTNLKLKARLPGPVDSEPNAWTGNWLEWREELEDENEGIEAEVNRKKYVSTKVRRTAKGVERQRVERTVENWTWTPTPQADGDIAVATGAEPVMKDEEMGDP